MLQNFIRRSLLLLCLLSLAASARAQEIEDALLEGVDDELAAAGRKGDYTIILVDNEGKPIEPRRFVRGIPGRFAVSEFPRVFAVEGESLFLAGPKLDTALSAGGSGNVKVYVENNPDFGDTPHYRSECTISAPPGRYAIQPFDMAFDIDGDLRALHPALSAEGKTLKIHLTPVTFRAADPKTGRAVPIDQVTVLFGRTNVVDGLLADKGRFNSLTLWLPRGTQYMSNFGSFSISSKGELMPGHDAAPMKDGAFVRAIPQREDAPPAEPGPGVWLASHNLRQVFHRGETVPMHVILVGQYPAGEVGVKAIGDAEEIELGKVSLPKVDGVDSRLILVDTRPLPAGRWRLAVDHPQAKPFTVEIVDPHPTTPIFLHALACCNNADFTVDPEGLAALKEAGVQAWLMMGHASALGDAGAMMGMGRAEKLEVPEDAPVELQRPVSGPRVVLENTLRNGLFTIDYFTRREGFYNEGLSFHHSYKPNVERIIRRVHLFAQEFEEFPAFRGFTYTWFPALGGYNEGGVPTDPYHGDRMRALNERIKNELNLTPLTREEAQLLRTDNPAKHPELVEKQRAFYRAQYRLGFFDHFALYNRKLREVRSDFIATTHENAGHDVGKSTRDLFGAHDAVGYESYTDYGDWYMSTPFVIDWAKGHLPDKPVWYTIDGTQTLPSQAAKAMYALSRGAEGIGTPVAAPTKKRINRRFAQINAFLAAYGPLVTAFERDPSIAVLTPEMDHGLFTGAHPMYSHLARLGYAPVILAEQTIEERGITPGTKVIFIPNPKAPFSAKVESALRKFIADGGKVVVVGEKPTMFEGAIHMDVPLLSIWDVGGFPFQLKMWEQFHIVKPVLQKQMDDLGFSPRNGADPEKVVILPFRSGGIDYVGVVSSPADTKDTDFYPVRDVKVKVGDARRVINLVTAQELQAQGGEVTLDLVSEPAALLVLLPGDVDGVELSHPAAAKAGQRVEFSAKAGVGEARLPVQIVLSDETGEIARFYRLSGDKVTYDLPAGGARKYTIAATDLITGASVSATMDVSDAPAAAVVEAPEVYVPTPHRMKLFLDRKEEIRVIVEDTQLDALEDAERLVKAFNAAGRSASVLRVDDTSFDTYWLRFYPGRSEQRVMDLIDADQVIGYRGNLKPFIRQSTRSHDPSKGGWTDIDPPYIIRKDVIVFGGGKIAQSLTAACDWLPTPHTPGSGRGVLAVVLSPFWADRHAVAVSATDPAGRTKAVDALLAMLEDRSRVPSDEFFRQPETVAATSTARGAEKRPLDTPMAGFVPPTVVKRVSISPDGFIAAETRTGTTILAPDGSIVGTVPADPNAFAPALSTGGRLVRGTTIKLAEGDWHITTGWKVQMSVIDAAAKVARTIELPGRYERASGFMKTFHDGFKLSPDGKTLFASRLGGGYMLIDIESGNYRLVREPASRLGFFETVRDPLFATGVAFSPDGKTMVLTNGHNPRGYGGMGTETERPYSTSIQVIDLESGKVLWRRESQDLRDPSLSAWNGQIAVANGGARVAYIDFSNTLRVLDPSGKEVWQQETTQHISSFRDYPRPVRTQATADGKVVMFALPGHVFLWREGEVTDLNLPELTEGMLSPDGSMLFAATADGVVSCYNLDGSTRWRYESSGDQPRIGVTALGLIVGEGAGNVILLDGSGQPKWKTSVLDLAPLKLENATMQLTGSPTYHEPDTLDVLKKHAAAKQVAAWTGQGEAAERFGRKFYKAAGEVKLSASGNGWHLVRLVYRHDKPATKVSLEAGNVKRVFELDLETPEYRVVDLPIESSGTLNVSVAGEGLEIAELSIHAYTLPGPNGAYIAPAGTDQNQRRELGKKEDDIVSGLEVDLNILDDTDASSIADSKAGKMKDVKIFSVNTDVDRIAGPYFRESGNPLETFDGQRFADGKPAPWTRWKPNTFMSYMGSRIVIDLGYVSKPKLCLTYDRTLKQSDVMRGIAILKGDKRVLAEPDLMTFQRRVITGAIENDQFFRVFDLTGQELEVLGVYVYGGDGKDHGLSEVELSE